MIKSKYVKRSKKSRKTKRMRGGAHPKMTPSQPANISMKDRIARFSMTTTPAGPGSRPASRPGPGPASRPGHRLAPTLTSTFTSRSAPTLTSIPAPTLTSRPAPGPAPTLTSRPAPALTSRPAPGPAPVYGPETGWTHPAAVVPRPLTYRPAPNVASGPSYNRREKIIGAHALRALDSKTYTNEEMEEYNRQYLLTKKSTVV